MDRMSRFALSLETLAALRRAALVLRRGKGR